MKIETTLRPSDEALIEKQLRDFVPQNVFDAHAHLLHDAHFARDNRLPYVAENEVLGLPQYRAAMARTLPQSTVSTLFFGFPRIGNDRRATDDWLAQEIGGGNNRALALVAPHDDPQTVAEEVRRLKLVGLKPYHVYAASEDTPNCALEEFVPEWMWELCHDISGVLMIHLVRDRAIADEDNQKTLRRLCRKYPKCRVVLAHVARSFNYRNAREGLSSLVDLDNVWLDTSAITETPAFAAALRVLGPRRVLFGSDYPISEFRGRCVALGDQVHWIYDDAATLVGIESLLCLREACDDGGLNASDVQDIFHDNALRVLAPHFATPEKSRDEIARGAQLWSHAQTKISGGTGLLSKWAERYDSRSWPSYYSRCSGCEIWDSEDRRLVDFHGGVGAILLGYNDPDVNAAVRRRIDAGSHNILISPDEIALAELLLELHPWAGRVRYARGGGEALAIAVRVARAATGKSGVAFCGYHGWHDWYLAANLGDDAALDGHLLPGLEPLGVPRELQGTATGFAYNDIESFESALQKMDGKLATVVMEPMRGAPPQDDFLQKVAARCREAGAVLVFDEVTSGWRFGFPGAASTLGVEPDIAVYAKAMSNGYACGAVVGRGEIMDAANRSFISSTYWTEGVGPAAALASIGKMRERGVQGEVWKKGEILKSHLEKLVASYPALQLKLAGLPPALTLTFDLGEQSSLARVLLIRKMIARGFLVSGLFYLMNAHTMEQIESLVETLDEVLGEISDCMKSDTLQQEVGTVQMREGFRRLA